MGGKLIVGNWKMHGRRDDALALTRGLRERLAQAGSACTWVVCPPFPLIPAVAEALAGSAVRVGGQDCHAAGEGAHTGDVAAGMLADAGCSHVIVGHSERRREHGETDADVRAKAEAAQAAGLTPIVCVGETRAQRDAGQTDAVLGRQIAGSLPDDPAAGLAVAYEPVWAIGTGLTPAASDIAAALASIRGAAAESRTTADRMRVLYGGSVKPANAAALWDIEGVDGLLVGAASLILERFWAIGRDNSPDAAGSPP